MNRKHWTERLKGSPFTNEELIQLAGCTAFLRLARQRNCPDNVLQNFATYITRPWLPFPACDWQQAYALLNTYAPSPKLIEPQHIDVDFDGEPTPPYGLDDIDRRLLRFAIRIALATALIGVAVSILSQLANLVRVP